MGMGDTGSKLYEEKDITLSFLTGFGACGGTGGFGAARFFVLFLCSVVWFESMSEDMDDLLLRPVLAER